MTNKERLVQIAVWTTPEEKEELTREAQKIDRTRSSFIRTAIREYYKKLRKEREKEEKKL